MMTNNDDLIGPVMKYVGSKRALAETVVALVPHEIENYVELCFGSGAEYFKFAQLGRLQSTRNVLISDYDPRLMDVYRAIKEDPRDLYSRLSNLTVAYAKAWDEAGEDGGRIVFDRVRELWNNRHCTPAKNLFLRYTTYNGLWRLSKTGRMHAPYGKYSKPAFPTLERLIVASQVLRRTDIEDGDLVDVAACCDYMMGPRSVLVLDPPYDEGFDQYTSEGFNAKDQERVINLAREWHASGATVIYHNHDTPLIRGLLESCWPAACIDVVGVARPINSDGTGRGKVAELLVCGKGRTI